MTDLEIIPLEPSHLESAARMVTRKYREQTLKVPCLPDRYADEAVVWGLLNDIIHSGHGAAAILDGKIAGFLAAWCLPSILGRPGAFSPEWANAISGSTDGRRVIDTLYAFLAPHWRAQGCDSHWVSLLADDTFGLECWNWLGFGMVAVDGLRSVEPLHTSATAGGVRLAGPEDLEAVLQLDQSLFQHISGPPIYLHDDTWQTPEDYRAWLADEDASVWIAEQDQKATAFITIGPAAEDTCTIIRDKGTASILAAYTEKDRRGEGLATALLQRSLEWARARGYVRCAVDFEPMNPWARRFWMRYFEPVAYTVVRHVKALEGEGLGDRSPA
jgi:GNAT superfamily N-acetyltransferase